MDGQVEFCTGELGGDVRLPSSGQAIAISARETPTWRVSMIHPLILGRVVQRSCDSGDDECSAE